MGTEVWGMLWISAAMLRQAWVSGRCLLMRQRIGWHSRSNTRLAQYFRLTCAVVVQPQLHVIDDAEERLQNGGFQQLSSPLERLIRPPSGVKPEATTQGVF